MSSLAHGPEQVTVSATEFAQLRYVAELIAEYEPGTRGPTLLYIQEQAARALGVMRIAQEA